VVNGNKCHFLLYFIFKASYKYFKIVNYLYINTYVRFALKFIVIIINSLTLSRQFIFLSAILSIIIISVPRSSKYIFHGLVDFSKIRDVNNRPIGDQTYSPTTPDVTNFSFPVPLYSPNVLLLLLFFRKSKTVLFFFSVGSSWLSHLE